MKESLIFLRMEHISIANMVEGFKILNKSIGIVGAEEDINMIDDFMEGFEYSQDEIISENYLYNDNVKYMSFDVDTTIPPLDIFIKKTEALKLDIIIFINPPKYIATQEEFALYRDHGWPKVITIFTSPLKPIAH